MPDPGVFQTEIEQFEIEYSNPIINTRIALARPLVLLDWAGDTLLGAATERRPRPVLTESKTGAIQWAYFHDYYNQLYLIPTRIDFGAISGSQSVEFYVWNAFLTTTTVSAITLSSSEGISLDGPALPSVMKPLALGEYTLTVTEAGPAIVDVVIDFDIGEPATIPLPVTGVRAYLAPFIPNWRQAVKVDIEFKTEITASRSGKEQRRAIRDVPRKRMEFTALAKNDKLRLVNQLLASAQDQVIILPEFTRRVRIPGAIESGALEVLLEEVPYWIIPEALVIFGNGERFESRRVATVEGLLVTFQSSSVEPWPAGVFIYPALSGTLGQDLQAKRYTNTVSEIAVVYDVLPGSEVNLSSGDEFTVFNGREVLLKKPNWGENPTVNYQHEWERVDYGMGVIARYHPIDFPTRLYRATFVGRSGEEAHAIREFFERAKGQRGEFYMPTWEADLVPIAPLQIATNTIRVDGPGAAMAFRESTVFKAVAVFTRDGQVYFNAVNDVFQDGGDSVVNGLTPWPLTINPSDVLYISWMPVWRHASDTLSMQWVTATVAQIQLTVQTLEDLPV